MTFKRVNKWLPAVVIALPIMSVVGPIRAALVKASRAQSAQQLKLTPYKATGIYGIGEKVGWTVTLPESATARAGYVYTVKRNNQDVIKTGGLDFVAGRATIEVTLSEPAMVYLRVSSASAAGSSAEISAGPRVGAPQTATTRSGPPRCT